MSSIKTKLQSTLVSLIKPLHTTSKKLSATYDIKARFSEQMLYELEPGPTYTYSKGFLNFGLISESSLNFQISKQQIESTNKEFLEKTLTDLKPFKDALTGWGQSIKNSLKDLSDFLYLLGASPQIIEQVSLSKEEAAKLSEIFSTLSVHFPYSFLRLHNSDPNMQIKEVFFDNPQNVFRALAKNFKSYSEEKAINPNTKLHLDIYNTNF